MPRLRVQFGGSLATVSTWSITTEYSLGSAITSLATLQAIANAVQAGAASGTYSAALKAGICADTTMVAPKLLYYPDGSPTATLVAEGTGAAVSGSPAAVHAPQVCVVASLRTDQAGRSRRGRSYVPYRGSAITASGQISGSGQNTVSAFIIALRANVIAALGAQSIAATWIVWSPKLSLGTQITAVYVGGQCDTLRDRNPNGDEVYAAYTPPPVVLSFAEGDDELERALSGLEGVRIKSADEALGDGFLRQVYEVVPIPAD